LYTGPTFILNNVTSFQTTQWISKKVSLEGRVFTPKFGAN